MAKDIGKLVKEHALKNRPPFYQWMHAHYAKLKPVLSQPRPSWKAVSLAAYEVGQKGEDGQPYSRQVAWKTWKQLCQDMELSTVEPPRRVKKNETTMTATPPAVRAPAPHASALPAGPTPDDDPDEPPDFNSFVKERR